MPVDRTASEEYDHVDVPSTIIDINEQQSVHLNSLVQPLAVSDSYGIDLYVRAREFLQQANIIN